MIDVKYVINVEIPYNNELLASLYLSHLESINIKICQCCLCLSVIELKYPFEHWSKQYLVFETDFSQLTVIHNGTQSN